MKLKGKVALITGGTSGIGEASARRFAAEGARVFVLGRNLDRGNEVVESIRRSGGQGDFVVCDVSNEESIRQAFSRVMEAAGQVDILLNSAGIAPGGTVETLSTQQWEEIFRVNVTSVYLFSSLAVPVMRAAGGGNIINVGSSAGTVGAWGLHGYSASKGAVVQLSRSMAAEYARENIRVNCLCPGATKTPMMDSLGEQDLQDFAEMIPAGRMAEPDEIAGAALFLASEDSSFMYGAVLLVDGGFTAI